MDRIDSLPWVLLVVNDPYLREQLSLWLQTSGSLVCARDDGHEALRYLLAAPSRPCVMLVDARLPTLDGLSLRKRLLLYPELARIPFVLMSDAKEGGSAHACCEGATTHLQRPFGRLDLLSKIAPYLKPMRAW